jgi:hypothetical protein
MGMPKLTPDEVVDIYLTGGKAKVVAREYGVGPGAIRDIRLRRTHKALTAPFLPEAFNAFLVSAAFVGAATT